MWHQCGISCPYTRWKHPCQALWEFGYFSTTSIWFSINNCKWPDLFITFSWNLIKIWDWVQGYIIVKLFLTEVTLNCFCIKETRGKSVLLNRKVGERLVQIKVKSSSNQHFSIPWNSQKTFCILQCYHRGQKCNIGLKWIKHWQVFVSY